jgi:hypothetical protein
VIFRQLGNQLGGPTLSLISDSVPPRTVRRGIWRKVAITLIEPGFGEQMGVRLIMKFDAIGHP